MIRILCRVAYRGAAAHVGGPVDLEYKTFDVELPEVEKWLTTNIDSYSTKEAFGIEIVSEQGRGV